jgi:hypothetical protein
MIRQDAVAELPERVQAHGAAAHFRGDGLHGMQRLAGLKEVQVFEHVEAERRGRVERESLDGFAQRPVAGERAGHGDLVRDAAGAHDHTVAHGSGFRYRRAGHRLGLFEGLRPQLPFLRGSQAVGGAGERGLSAQARARAGEDFGFHVELEAA